MSKSRENCIPTTAIEVKITSVVSPSIMRIYEVADHAEKAEEMSKKIQYLFKKKKLDRLKSSRFKLGDTVIVHNGICTNLELPAWSSRGILGYAKDHEKTKYSVFFVDYGISLDLTASEFIKVPKNLIADDFLTSTIGLYDLLPTVGKVEEKNLINDEDTITVTALKEWTKQSILLTKKLIGSARKIFFEPLVFDESGRKFGEIYLFIEDAIIRLSESLVMNRYAIYITDEVDEALNTGKNAKNENGNVTFPYSLTKKFETKEYEETNSEAQKTNNQTGFFALFTKDLNLMKLQDGQTVLVHSNIKCDRLNVLTTAKFPVKIHKVLLDKNITSVRRIQSYIWPAVMKGLSVVAVSSSGTGKTYGHAVGISSSLAMSETLHIQSGNVPVALILCSSSKEIFEMHSLYTDFLYGFPYIKIVAAYNGKSERALASEILNGCQLLISTPPFLQRLMTSFKNTSVLDLRKLQFLIFDKADIIFDKYSTAVSDLITKHEIINNKQRCIDAMPLQIVTVSRQWSIPLKKFVFHYIKNPYICIDSCMEAAIYTGVQSRAIISLAAEKTTKILQMLTDVEEMQRTMILCAETEEVVEVEEFLKSHGKRTVVAHGDMDFIKIDEMKSYWEKSISGLFPIFIATDEVLSDLGIGNVDHLINYSLPPYSKRQFHQRFTTIMDNLLMGSKQSKITILLDESNDLQLKSLMDPMKRLNINIPEAWMKSSAGFIIKEDRKKTNFPICDKVKSLGFCPNSNFCSDRHCILSDVDAPKTNLQKGDEVKFMVTFVHDVSHYSARVIDYTRLEGGQKVTVPFEADFMKLTTEMQKYFSQPKNKRHRKVIEVGEIYTWEQTLDNFKRVKILKITMRDKADFPMAVNVRCIDDGVVIENVHALNILEIPEELAEKPSHIVDIFLTGIAPYDDEFDWNECANSVAHDWFRQYYKKTSFYYGKILLHVADTVWLDSLEIRSKVSGYSDLINSSLKPTLIRNHHGIANKNHLKNLLDLCQKGGFQFVDSIDE